MNLNFKAIKINELTAKQIVMGRIQKDNPRQKPNKGIKSSLFFL
jgi:hypothetical protein